MGICQLQFENKLVAKVSKLTEFDVDLRKKMSLQKLHFYLHAANYLGDPEQWPHPMH